MLTPPPLRDTYPLLASLGLFLLLSASVVAQSTHVKFEMNTATGQAALNTIFLELFDDRPITTTNFLQYVEGSLYDNVLMHRAVQGFVLQGGGFQDVRQSEPAPLDWSVDTSALVDLDGNPQTANPTIVNEFDGTRSNVRGTLGMAKLSSGPNTASNQWFFNLANNGPNLDFQNGGFTTFAQVVGNGMDLVDFISAHRTSNFNPDFNDDGIIDGGALTDAPFFINDQGEIDLFKIVEAKRTDYLGSGTLTDVPNSNLFLSEDLFIDSGAGFTGPGRFSINAGVEMGVADGVAIPNRIDNFGVLAPGNQIGGFSTTNYSQFAGASLQIQLAGTTAGTQHDQLIVDGIAVLEGSLDVELLNGFEPSLGDEFVVLDADLIQANFTEFNLPTLRDSLLWEATKTNTAITLTVRGGDYNNDGIVNHSDFIVWQNNLGGTGIGIPGDGNADGIVDGADYAVWRNSFLATAAASQAIAGVPEPSTLSVLCLSFAAFGGCQRRRA